jgi:hypothetical protein
MKADEQSADEYAPGDRICQARLRGSKDPEADWQTLTFGTPKVGEAWSRQVAPRLRRLNHETRVLTGAQANERARALAAGAS